MAIAGAVVFGTVTLAIYNHIRITEEMRSQAGTGHARRHACRVRLCSGRFPGTSMKLSSPTATLGNTFPPRRNG